MEFKNDLGLVGKIAAHSVMSGKYKDKDGNVKEILPVGPGNSLDFDQFREDIGAFDNNSSSGGNTIPDGTDTSGGINIIPGSLSDGSLCGRYLEWEGQTKANEDNTIEFKDDVGTNLNRIGDGFQFKGYLQKIAVVDGVKSDPTVLQLKYDPKNVKDSGYFVTTSPIPFSISRNQFNVGRKLTITLNGIGEGLADVKSHVSPSVSFTFNADKSMKIETTAGHDLDTGTVKANGAIYTYVLERVNSYSVQAPVTQLPSGMTLMSGDASGDIPLNFVNDDYSNISGLQITFNPRIMMTACSDDGKTPHWAGHNCLKFDELGFSVPSVYKISKENLLLNSEIANTHNDVGDSSKVHNYHIEDDGTLKVSDSFVLMPSYQGNKNTYSSGPILIISNNKLTVNFQVFTQGPTKTVTYTLSVLDVSTY